MALSAGNIVLWSDINAVLSNVNQARAKIGLGATSISGGGVGTYTRNQNIVDLYNGLRAMNGFKLPAQGGTISVSIPAAPGVGTYLTASQLVAINNEANRIKSGYHFSGFNSSFNSNFNASFNSGFNSGFNSSHNSGWNSGWNSSNFSNCGFCSNNNSDFWCSGFQSGGFGWGGCGSGFFAQCGF